MMHSRFHCRAASRVILGRFVGGCLLVLAASAFAQQGYGQYYQKDFKKTGGGLGAGNSNKYLYDKYFYHRPTVSPYLNLGRGGGMSGSSYQTYVRPELERREAADKAQSAYLQQRKLEGKIGETRFPGSAYKGGTIDPSYLKPVPAQKSTPSAYYNHWYGGWQNR